MTHEVIEWRDISLGDGEKRDDSNWPNDSRWRNDMQRASSYLLSGA